MKTALAINVQLHQICIHFTLFRYLKCEQESSLPNVCKQETMQINLHLRKFYHTPTTIFYISTDSRRFTKLIACK